MKNVASFPTIFFSHNPAVSPVRKCSGNSKGTRHRKQIFIVQYKTYFNFCQFKFCRQLRVGMSKMQLRGIQKLKTFIKFHIVYDVKTITFNFLCMIFIQTKIHETKMLIANNTGPQGILPYTINKVSTGCGPLLASLSSPIFGCECQASYISSRGIQKFLPSMVQRMSNSAMLYSKHPLLQ